MSNSICHNSEPPSLAVVIPCWNAEQWISRAIQSVLGQRYPSLEIIVIDDGSTDGSLAIIESFGHKIRWATGPNNGACAARNSGLAAVRSEYVLFMDADDHIEGDFLNSIVSASIEQATDVMFGVSRSEKAGKVENIYQLPAQATQREILRCYLVGRYTQTGAILWRAQFIREIGGWNAGLLRNQDIELVLRALLRGARARSTSAGFLVWNQHDGLGRISRRAGEAVTRSEIAYHDALLMHVDECDVPTRVMLGRRYYILATEAYFCGAATLGKYALERSRSLGFRHHEGSALGILVASVAGLRAHAFVRRKVRSIRGQIGADP
jgi:glycosyltransferase involved in cell wall biosynthesis